MKYLFKTFVITGATLMCGAALGLLRLGEMVDAPNRAKPDSGHE
ncbi:Uncharacterised protein [Bordetella ansorpii]|uniref:Uncharacterized protein n=1 Tax=Bordetella ansorpii TaxID=288768 RepID=A0A157LFR9_9BORD|nr:hypothetical protein [Bordetella ansorpii]SAH95547.1 Uncharacterised protein [Bordetella ansorpii]